VRQVPPRAGSVRLAHVVTVRIADQDDADEVGRVLADGFDDDPVMGWVFSEPGRAGKLDAFFAFLAREALVPLGATYVLPGSCASWTPPGSPGWPDERAERFGELLERVCTATDIERLGILDGVTREHHPDGEHWYLGTIATTRDRRGQGLGSALLRASLEHVDATGLPSYLESTNPRNVPVYERHGFRSTGTIELPGGPALTAMWRDPRGR
jgi:GNAT superfamily N-acetyltransferase